MTIQYKKRITAFLDVLGFSEIVLNSNHNLIQSYFNYLTDSLKPISAKNNLTYYYISDTIIITAIDKKENLIKVIDSVRFIQSQLLAKNILLRGAISIGDLYLHKTNNIIVGPGLVNAYELEKLAKYPRIIIDRKLISHFKFLNTIEFINFLNTPFNDIETHEQVSIDFDNYLFVNYISYICTRRQNYTTRNTITDIYSLIQQSYFKNLHLEKYSWLAKKFISELEKQYTLISELRPASSGSASQRRLFRSRIPIWLDKFKQL